MYKFLGIYLGMKLLHHNVTLWLTFRGTAKLFSRAAIPFYNPTRIVWGFQYHIFCQYVLCVNGISVSNKILSPVVVFLTLLILDFIYCLFDTVGEDLAVIYTSPEAHLPLSSLSPSFPFPRQLDQDSSFWLSIVFSWALWYYDHISFLLIFLVCVLKMTIFSFSLYIPIIILNFYFFC